MKNVTLQEWLEIDRTARKAASAMQELMSRLVQLAADHIHDKEVLGLLEAVEDRLSDGHFVAGSFQLQGEWLGGDNDGLREPNALSIIGHIPHLIRGSRGVKRLS